MGRPAICWISAKVSLKLSVPFSLIHTHKASYLLMESPCFRLIESEKLPNMLAYQLHDLYFTIRFPIA